MSLSPTAEGFRAAFRRPSLTLGEIAWRWVTGATAAALFLFGLCEYLDTLPLTNGELLFLRSRQPYLIAQAIAHILHGSLNRAMMAALLAALLLALLWMVAASVGRIATVRALLEYFRRDVAGYVSAGSAATAGQRGAGDRDVASNVSTTAPVAHHPFPALVRLNFLRAAVALAAAFGLVGAAILAGFASHDMNPRPGIAFLLFLPLAALIALVWISLNWILSLAGLFAVRDGEDTMGAISAAASFCRDRTGAVFAVSIWTWLAHLVAFVAASTAASMPLGFVAIVPWRLVVLLMLLVTLAYFALADWLYTARLAGYVCIAEMPEARLAPAMPAPMPVQPPVSGPPVKTTIDRDELILSDTPKLAVET